MKVPANYFKFLFGSMILLMIMGLLVTAGIGGWPYLFSRPASSSVVIGATQGRAPRISDSALRQIRSLLDEKASRSPAQQKLDSQLLYAVKMLRGQEVAAGLRTLEVNAQVDQQEKTVVDITAVIGGSLLEELAAK
ncbi:MAG TPA: hypothetical protein VJ810_22760 [Blastocatellia bacterium]|nr:hypothetical protein [Blastocatellia bacterium]